MYIQRTIEKAVKRMTASFPVVLITGARQVGKTTVFRSCEETRNYVSLDTLCKLSDVIMLHAPLTPMTYHLIDKDKIALMKDTAIIVNTARGELIDTEALYNALIDNRLSGAALDVLEYEETISNKRPGANINLKNLRTSLINNKLLNLSNVIVTPHIAYDTQEAVNRILEKTLENLYQYANGEEIKNLV